MRLALNLGYWGTGSGRGDLVLVDEAERLGYASVWAAEAYGSDAPSVLSWIAARTSRIGVGSAVMQIPARTPAMTAMTAATIDALSGGRFSLGLGVSGPQVSEGWHGVRFDRPLSRTREYVEVVRRALARERLVYAGTHWNLPLPDGPGKALQLTVRPERDRIPVYLAAIGPRNLELTGEIADGWLAVFYAPEHAATAHEHLRRGRARVGSSDAVPAADDVRITDDVPGDAVAAAGPGAVPLDPAFDVMPTVPVVIGDDVQACADRVRAYTALYIGGMGSREENFYNQLATRMGFGDAATRVQDLFLDRQHRAAAAAVPFELIDQTALIGPADRIRDRLAAYAESGVTTLSVAPMGAAPEERRDALRSMVEALEAAGLGC